MTRKAFCIQVELDIQSVTCPGVWLCSNGKVALHIYMLDSCVQTTSYKPLFPIALNETFLFYKTFYPKHQLYELQRELHNQWLYVELVQWQSCEIGTVLASFQTSLDELLFPSTAGGSLAGVDLDLLMEPSKNFPGSIAPKVEVSTRTTIEESLCFPNKSTSSKSIVVNPKVIVSQGRNGNVTRRKVCHSIGFSKKNKRAVQLPKRPPFVYRKAEDDLILRKPQLDCNSTCHGKDNNEPIENRIVRRHCPCTAKACGCGHRDKGCSVCKSYKNTFTSNSDKSIACSTKSQPPRTSLFPPKNVCFCTESNVKKPSLVEKLHEKFVKTLSHMHRVDECPCFDDEDEYRCNMCESSSPPHSSKVELYRDLHKMYGNLYEKARSSLTSCLHDSCQCDADK